jgi:hypothetical protein
MVNSENEKESQMFQKVGENQAQNQEKPEEAEKKPEEVPTPEKLETVKDEVKVVIPDQKSEKSFFEIMWEREHPEEVKKLNLAEEQKKMAEKV